MEHKASSIPQFALYGELDSRDVLAFVHIETIRARSSPNGWLIAPHRHPHLFQLLSISQGEAEVRLDNGRWQHKGKGLVLIPPGVVHGFRFQPETDGFVFSLDVHALAEDSDSWAGELLKGPLEHPHLIPVKGNSPRYHDVQSVLSLIARELGTASIFQRQALSALVKLLLIAVCRQLDAVASAGSAQSGRDLAGEFRTLLDRHYAAHWSVNQYATELHVSVSTLNRACHQMLGHSAKKHIQMRVHAEARRRLIYTRDTLSQIADALGYKDVSYFSRVFKLQEGVSPRDYRQRVECASLEGYAESASSESMF